MLIFLILGISYCGGSYDIVGKFPINEARGVYVTGGYAYLAVDMVGLKILDISDPTNPQEIGNVSTSYARNVFVSGSYAYVADGVGLKIVDASDPTSPFVVSSVSTNYAKQVYVYETFAYVADGNGLKIIDVSDPAMPMIVSSYETPESIQVFVYENLAYLSDDIYGLYILDVSNKTNPTKVGKVGASTPVWSYIESGFLYVLGGSYQHPGMYIYSLKDHPENPTFVGKYDRSSVHSVSVNKDSDAFIACGSKGFYIVDVSDPSDPDYSDSFSSKNAFQVFTSGEFTYLVDYSYGLKIIGRYK